MWIYQLFNTHIFYTIYADVVDLLTVYSTHIIIAHD